MWIVRPARHGDIVGIEQLAIAQGPRVSTLPQAQDELAEKIDYAARSLAGEPATKGCERFLFVLEDAATGTIRGTAGLDASAGNGQPFYNYRLDELIHASHELAISTRVPILYLSHELTGRTLLCSFTIAEDLRHTVAFDLLSRSRLLFVHQHRALFCDELIVEIQGVQDEQGNSPFWDSLGRQFFGMDFATADYYSAVKSRTFLAELMPPHPIYVTLLSEAAQHALGEHHSAAARTWQVLHREGFSLGRHLDIFDGGPTLEARVGALNTINNCRHRKVKLGKLSQGLNHIVATNDPDDFRCSLGKVGEGLAETVQLEPDLVEALRLQDNQSISVVAL